ncbi:hypothetical protein M407DRAFT_132596 [Tulasnella calospora MUT 4182]|uniref:Nudix hydrolase domain-containing protein n=1 Tax=Tulasnella calospora MUT 4182 TaxID=1051891 RepID=A0A0C3LHJ3_9AGAM|nr:hypothetical protein M407DRAFT_132596 [Tulasnella calospora MUT 4182]
MTLLPIVERCDNFSLDTTKEQLVPFHLSKDSTVPVGFLYPSIVQHLLDYNSAPDHWRPNAENNATADEPPFGVSSSRVYFSPSITTFQDRSALCKHLCEKWRDTGLFSDVIGGRLWRNELYPIYPLAMRDNTTEGAAFVMERVCCALFGFVTYGVHMTMYTEDGRIWVPRRAKTKQTWPGLLDNSVAGGIPYGLKPMESLIKECMEEASLPEEIAKNAKTVGCASYFYQTRTGWLQPEVEYVYDLCVPAPDVGSQYIPKPLDGEVESFELMTVEEVIQHMRSEEFKPNCAVVLLDFLIRHGHITPENEPNYIEILTRIHARFGFERYPNGVNTSSAE